MHHPLTYHQTALTVLILYLGKRESSAKFESTAIMPYDSENAQFKPLVVIECRGLEFTGFDPRVRCYMYHPLGMLAHGIPGYLEMCWHERDSVFRGRVSGR